MNDEIISRKQTPNIGVQLQLTNEDGKSLFSGSVHPNVQYEYETESAGQYKLCVKVDDKAYSSQKTKIKTDIKFSAEFNRSKFRSAIRVKIIVEIKNLIKCTVW